MLLSESAAGMAAEPLVSVVIPVYNVSRYLPECLESVMRQTYRNLDIVVIDDGSTDGGGKICDRFARKDVRIRVFHTENRGLSAARNHGIVNARGDYVAFVDSDDWIEANMIETLMKAMIQNNADIAAAWYIMEYKGGRPVAPSADGSMRIFRGEEILYAFINLPVANAVWNKLYRIGLFKDIRFPEGRNYEDIATTWKRMKFLSENGGTLALLSARLYHLRMRKSSISHMRTLSNYTDCWEAFREQYEGLPAYREQLTSKCLDIIARMWLIYGNFSGEERQRAEAVIMNMNAFSKAHFSRVMKGKYSLMTKIYCLLSQSRSPGYMRFCAVCGTALRSLMNPAGKYFD